MDKLLNRSFGYQSIIDKPARVKSNFVKSLSLFSSSEPSKAAYSSPVAALGLQALISRQIMLI